jgi:hypothetical protein
VEGQSTFNSSTTDPATISQLVTEVAMEDEPIELVHGSGNIFKDFGRPFPQKQQLKCLVAAQILGSLERQNIPDEEMVVRVNAVAKTRNRITVDTLRNIRKVKFQDYSLGRLVEILEQIDPDVELDLVATYQPPALRA